MRLLYGFSRIILGNEQIKDYRISKKPILAVEVDGYEYHKEDTEQASLDLLKDHIMDLYEILLLRFKTNGSREREQLVERLDVHTCDPIGHTILPLK